MNRGNCKDCGADLSIEDYECSICFAEFNIEVEGGIAGCIGLIPVAFCPTCLNGVVEMVDELGLYLEDETDDEFDEDNLPIG